MRAGGLWRIRAVVAGIGFERGGNVGRLAGKRCFGLHFSGIRAGFGGKAAGFSCDLGSAIAGFGRGEVVHVEFFCGLALTASGESDIMCRVIVMFGYAYCG